MNVQEGWECQECFRLHKTEDDALECHPPRRVFICGHCETDYEDRKLAELCGVEGAGPHKVDIGHMRNYEL